MNVTLFPWKETSCNEPHLSSYLLYLLRTCWPLLSLSVYLVLSVCHLYVRVTGATFTILLSERCSETQAGEIDEEEEAGRDEPMMKMSDDDYDRNITPTSLFQLYQHRTTDTQERDGFILEQREMLIWTAYHLYLYCFVCICGDLCLCAGACTPTSMCVRSCVVSALVCWRCVRRVSRLHREDSTTQQLEVGGFKRGRGFCRATPLHQGESHDQEVLHAREEKRAVRLVSNTHMSTVYVIHRSEWPWAPHDGDKGFYTWGQSGCPVTIRGWQNLWIMVWQIRFTPKMYIMQMLEDMSMWTLLEFQVYQRKRCIALFALSEWNVKSLQCRTSYCVLELKLCYQD